MTWQRRFIDGRIQTVFVPAPAKLPTFVFDQQRKVCELCARHHVVISPRGDRELGCTLHGRKRVSCSSARLPDGCCGPEAREFRAKVVA